AVTGALGVSVERVDRPRNVYIVWRDYQRRAEAIGPLLDADVVFLPHRFKSRWLRPLDYLLKTVLTASLLLNRRPGFAVFQSPPHFGSVVAAVLGVPYVIGAHNATIQGRWARVPGTRFALAHARAVVVHNDEIAALTKSRFPEARL